MEKLELKHLAPYLPYGLQLMMLSEPNNQEPNIEQMRVIDASIKMINFGWGNAKEFSDFKPILRPLSDLDILIRNEFENYHRNKEYNKEIIDFFCAENGFDELIVNLDMDYIQYRSAEYIFKNHYDFFGLIDKGLAIDINKI